MLGKTISHYKIIEKLGEGGMGVVYRALDTRLDRGVAIKFLPPHLSSDPQATDRFIHEAKAASSIDHRNIGTIYDIDETDEGITFIVMALYEGETLRQRIDSGEMGVEVSLDIVLQIAAGLSRAHQKGIIHRDIKPSNIIITKDSEVKIIDFGLAKLAGRTRLTRDGSTIGTAAYMSPEQARGEELDHRSDIFSLGSILYEMIAGTSPFTGEHEAALLYGIVHEAPRPLAEYRPGIQPEIEFIVERALEKSREKRYQSVDDLIEDIVSIRIDRSEDITGSRREGCIAADRKKNIGLSSAAMAAVLIIVLLIYRYAWHGEEIDSIAVLPLVNVSEDRDEEYFTNGLTGELISQLAQIGGLKVISRTSIMQYKDTDKSLPEIAEELNVSSVLEGTVLRVGGTVRISLELIHAGTDRSIWAHSYERNLNDILELQGEVALDVARKVKVELTADELEMFSNIQPVSMEAHEAYLKGRFYWNQRTLPALEKSLEFFSLAVTVDSCYAEAYSGLADAYIMLENYGGYGPSSTYPQARKAALKAIELNDRLAADHNSLAIVKWHYDWDLPGAEREFELAVSLNPNYATAHHWYAIYLALTGHHEKSKDEIEKALAVDPVSLIVNAAVGLIYYFSGDYSEAIRRSRQTLEMDANFFAAYTVLGKAYFQKGEHGESIESLRREITLSGRRSNILAILAHPLVASGRVTEAEEIYRELLERVETRYVSPYDMAVVSLALGNHDEALGWLERACEDRSSSIFNIRAEPLFKTLWDRPEFVALMSRMGLIYGSGDS